ncbi:MAG: DUF192 domain-containing protein [Desulfitobacteriaceae bacterium]
MLKTGIVYNLRTNQIIGDCVWKADSFLSRLRGLLGHSYLKPGEGLWLAPCQQVHMIGMHFALSVWFLDQSGKICDILDELKPYKISQRRKDAVSVIEFPVGWAKITDTLIGDTLRWEYLI